MRRHKPKGWTVREYAPGADGRFRDVEDGGRAMGLADLDDHIIHCVRVTDRYSLAVYLHECGHAHMKHQTSDSSAQDEYEAEIYAITALRAGGVSVPRGYLTSAKEYVGSHAKAESDLQHSEPLLRFAFGKRWREHI
jgi:hypothetical protein